MRLRYLTCIFHGIYWPLIQKFRCVVKFLLDLDLNNSKTSVLLVFKDILFALSQVVRSFTSWLICLFIFLKGYLQVKLVSSAKWCTLLNFKTLFKSLIYVRRNSGPRTEPCGTPNSIKALSDASPLIVTCCFLLVR